MGREKTARFVPIPCAADPLRDLGFVPRAWGHQLLKDLCPCPGSRACPSIHPTGTEHANASYSLLRTRGAEHGPAAASQLGYGAEGWDLGGCRALGGARCCPHSSGWPCARHLAGTCPSVPVPLVLPAPSPVPSSLPRSQLAARQGCRWARDFFFFAELFQIPPLDF